MPSGKSTRKPGYKTMHDHMDDHVKRENRRSEQFGPRRTRDPRKPDGTWDKSQHRPVTKGARVKRAQPVAYPYGGKPYESYGKPFRAGKQWKRTIQENVDQIGKRAAREASRVRPGCALITVTATEVDAMRYKIQAAVKGGQLRDRLGSAAGSELYRTRITRALDTLAYAKTSKVTVTLGVFTRGELRIIGAQRLKAKYVTRHTRTLEAKLAGNRR